MYTHGQHQEMVASNASLASAADIGDFAPGYMPFVIEAVALVFTTAANATGAVKVDKRPTAGSDTSRGDGDIATLNYTTATGAVGKVVYIDGLNIKIAPGEEAVFQVTNATPTAGNAHLILFGRHVWETPANNADMALTT